ncbi:MAG: ferrous iron transport protein A [Gemmatimonadales bacterium]|nr:ferrous iron transport protein A [Gemmatimonadales bacterium]
MHRTRDGVTPRRGTHRRSVALHRGCAGADRRLHHAGSYLAQLPAGEYLRCQSPLGRAPEGEVGEIPRLAGGLGTRDRLARLGLVPGRVIRGRSAGGRPRLVELPNGHLRPAEWGAGIRAAGLLVPGSRTAG